ncbi:MAG: phage terminase large subunit family protein, partial [Planctomycetota bacterium]
MKATQLGLSACAENIIAYYMDELKKWATKRLEPLIDSCGIRHKISAQTENIKSRRSGDLIFTKEFVGGALDMSSAQSAAGLRSDSKRILIPDEVDGAPPELRTGEGNWLEVARARTNAWGTKAKIFILSTPTTYDTSMIYSEY